MVWSDDGAGCRSFKLCRLAPAKGFKAHEALGYVEQPFASPVWLRIEAQRFGCNCSTLPRRPAFRLSLKVSGPMGW